MLEWTLYDEPGKFAQWRADPTQAMVSLVEYAHKYQQLKAKYASYLVEVSPLVLVSEDETGSPYFYRFVFYSKRSINLLDNLSCDVFLLYFTFIYFCITNLYIIISQGWPETTDPQKFVFEELGIAAYLCILFDRIPSLDLFPNKFVDLGCGNGLLTYVLNQEGYPGCRTFEIPRQNYLQRFIILFVLLFCFVFYFTQFFILLKNEKIKILMNQNKQNETPTNLTHFVQSYLVFILVGFLVFSILSYTRSSCATDRHG